ncbi:MAG TPA: hypothetical protein GX691_01170 [Clostridia bacterium]|nr:hypothetical protein [Clostridia bacterium]
MDLVRFSFGIMTLGFVLVTHLIGFNNVRVLEVFWIPEFVLIVYVVYSLIPVEAIPGWYKKLKAKFQERGKGGKVVKLKQSRRKKVSLPVILDGVLITLVAGLFLFLLYRI